MGRIIISWDYGIRLLDNDYLVSELIRLQDELANFNWDYMMRPSIHTEGMVKVTDPDEIDARYDWLSKAIPELKKMCKERGIDFEKEAHRKEMKSLASRLNDFYKDYDYYDYTDKLEVDGTEQDVIDDLVVQLNDFTAVNGILITLKEIKEESELNSEQVQVLNKLIEDVEEVLSSFGKSVEDALSEATVRSEQSKQAEPGAQKENVGFDKE